MALQTVWILAVLFLTGELACKQGSDKPTPAPSEKDKAGATGTGSKTARSTSTSLGLVTYEGWVKGYLEGNCVKCHGDGDDYDMSSYAKAKELASEMLASMESGTMPKNGKATKDQIAKMKAWVSGGKLEKEKSSGSGAKGATISGTATSTSKGTTPVTVNPSPGGSGSGSGGIANLTWARDIEPLFRSSCGTGSNSCHGPGARFGDFTTLTRARSAGRAISNAVDTGRMPVGRTMSNGDRQKIVTWVNQGAN